MNPLDGIIALSILTLAPSHVYIEKKGSAFCTGGRMASKILLQTSTSSHSLTRIYMVVCLGKGIVDHKQTHTQIGVMAHMVCSGHHDLDLQHGSLGVGLEDGRGTCCWRSRTC